MKKTILTIFFAATLFAANAQEAKTMYVMKNGEVAYQSVVSEIDSIIFYEPNLTNDPLTYDEGVVINGIKWATRNVDAFGKFAAKPEDPGKFYQWNRKTAWSATEPGKDVAIGEAGGWDDTIPAGTTWEPANDPSPAGWRVPTREEQQKLFDGSKVKNEWTKINGVFGRKFTDLANEDNFIFLPAFGCRGSLDGTLYGAGEYGYYWSSTQNSSSSAHCLDFNEWYADWSINYSSFGLSVRAVAE